MKLKESEGKDMTINNWERWCLGLTTREKKRIICNYYPVCTLCPLDKDKCENTSYLTDWLDQEWIAYEREEEE